MNTISDRLVEMLKKAGVVVVFGVPSIHNLGLYESLRKAPAIRHILCRHESTATHMADGYARESGKLGVVVASTGPGAGYAVPALQEALGSSVPLLLINTNIPSGKIGKGFGALHELEKQERIFQNVTKKVLVVRRAIEAESQMRNALEAGRTGRPGPVYLEIPTDLLMGEAPSQIAPLDESFAGLLPSPDLKKAVALLRKAENPLILIGTAALRAGLSKEVIALAETLGAPVLFTPGARGMIPDDHPLALGNGACRGLVRETVSTADLALAVGTRLREVDAKRRGLSLPKLIHMDWDEQWMGRNYPTEIAIAGDLVQTVKTLIREIDSVPQAETRKARMREIMSRIGKERDRINEEQPELAYLYAIRDAIPRRGTLVADNTQLGYWSEYFYPCYVPGGWIGAKGSAIIGYAFAAAIGVKLAAPEKPVVALIGDGGFLYSSQEMATCMRQRVAFPVIVSNSGSYGVVGYLQKKFYKQEYETRLRNPDFLKMAGAYGIKGCRVNSPLELGEALKEALSSGEMRLIELLKDFPEPPFDKY